MVQCVSATTSSCSQNKDRPCPVSCCLEHSTKRNKLTRSLRNYKQHAVLSTVVIAVVLVLSTVVVTVVVILAAVVVIVLAAVVVAVVVVLSAVVIAVVVVLSAVAVVVVLAAVVVTVLAIFYYFQLFQLLPNVYL